MNYTPDKNRKACEANNPLASQDSNSEQEEFFMERDEFKLVRAYLIGLNKERLWRITCINKFYLPSKTEPYLNAKYLIQVLLGEYWLPLCD